MLKCYLDHLTYMVGSPRTEQRNVVNVAVVYSIENPKFGHQTY
jgi:hypothetical protein